MLVYEKKFGFISSFKTLCTEIYFEAKQKKKNEVHFFIFTQTQTVIISSQQLGKTELKYPKEQGLSSTFFFLLLKSLIYLFFKYLLSVWLSANHWKYCGELQLPKMAAALSSSSMVFYNVTQLLLCQKLESDSSALPLGLS